MKGEGTSLFLWLPRIIGTPMLSSHCLCLFILPALPLTQQSPLSCKILCAGEGTNGTKVLLAICQSNPLSFPTWCLQTDGQRAKGTSHGPPPGQTRICEVVSVSLFSASFREKGRKINLLCPSLRSLICALLGVTVAAQTGRNPGTKESEPKQV